ncbi:hypothetical protein G6514_001432 [Epicoccum nigrum]|nr:hypothetical protein G6514_001432 [Epicoccum nigrum]
MSTSAPTSAPQLPEITTTSTAGHTTTAQTEVPAQPSAHGAATTAPNSNPLPTSTPAPTSNATTTGTLPAPSANPAATTSNVPAEQEKLSYNEQLNAADRLWKFKMVLTVALILANLIGIGCIAWAVQKAGGDMNGFTYGDGERWALPWGLITSSISIVFCVTCIARFLSRKRPVHPGIRVTMDLLLWLGFIFTALLTMVALYDVIYWGADGTIGSSEGFSSRYGSYELQRNNTWIWVADSSSSSYSSIYYGSQRTCDSRDAFSNYYAYETVPFHNCDELDAYVNQLWRAKPNHARVELTAVVCQWIAVGLHFALFVWACVDCHKKRRGKISNDAEKLAASIVQTMVQNGAIVPTSRQLHTRANGWHQAYEPLQSAPGSFSAQGGYPPQHMWQGRPQQGYQGYQQPPMMRGANQQMQGPAGPQTAQQQGARPVSLEGPLPPLPPRPVVQDQGVAQAGPSKGKEPAAQGGVAASYYEPGQ